jgi:hypothetical protein
MKYSPIEGEYCKNRKYVGKHWNKKYLRAIQCILIVTHGVVGSNKDFFEKAFGKNRSEFNRIMLMPEQYIIYREKHEKNAKVYDWFKSLNGLSKNECKTFFGLIKDNDFKAIDKSQHSGKLAKVMEHYY